MKEFLEKYDNTNIKQEKTITYTSPLEDTIKEKLYQLARKGYGVPKPQVITISLINKAIENYKNENHIFFPVNMNNVKEISLSFSKIIKIAYLENLVSLEKLKLDNNIIMKIENLSSLTNLKWLDLSFNNISKIENLNSLVALTDLSLFNNEIKKVEGLDLNNNLNILSVGNNRIEDVKEMVDYLKKFNNLQGLTVSGNYFNKDVDSGSVNVNTQVPSFPLVYETIIVGLDNLKYLDYRPVDPDERARLQLSNKGDYGKDREVGKGDSDKERSLEADAYELTKANSKYIITFWAEYFEKCIKDDSIQTAFEQVPQFLEKMKILEAEVRKPLYSYRDEILKLQIEKEAIIKEKIEIIEANLEEIVNKSKGEISEFKKVFKNYFAQSPDTINLENVYNKIKLKELKDKLYEIELFNKKETDKKIEALSKELSEKMENMRTETKKL